MDSAGAEQKPNAPEDSPKFFEIDAPENLALGQNFFDQEPFQQIIKEVSQETKIEEERIRRLLNAAAHTRSRGDTNHNLTSQKLALTMQQEAGRPRYFNDIIGNMSKAAAKQEFRKAIKLLGAALQELPYWYEYIVTQHTRGSYKYDGSATASQLKADLPESYAKWASDRIRMNHRQVSLGIDEVFPQDFAKESPMTAPGSIRSRKPGSRVWPILKASELIK